MELIDDGLGNDLDFAEPLFFDVLSVADWSVEGVGRRIGEVFDECELLCPSLYGADDPPRTPVGSFADVVEGWVPEFSDSKRNSVLFQHPGTTDAKPESMGTITASPGRCGMAVKPAHRFTLGHSHSDIEVSARADWFEQRPERLDEVVGLFTALCERVDAFFGAIDLPAFVRQRRALANNGYEAGTITKWQSEGARQEQKWNAQFVEDVFWVQFYGPSFLAKWGRDALSGVGVEQRRTDNGGVVVVATATPFEFDPLAEELGAYEWKRPFYEALGRDVFLTEGQVLREPGEVVPTYYDHAAHLRDGPSASTAEFIENRLRELG